MEQKLTRFTQLRTWQKSRDFAVASYRLTKSFPKDEMFGLTSQLRRSAVSVSANIAEGFFRSTATDKSRFYIIALGSLTESLSHMFIAKDLGYVTDQELDSYESDTYDLTKMINGMIKSAKGRVT